MRCPLAQGEEAVDDPDSGGEGFFDEAALHGVRGQAVDGEAGFGGDWRAPVQGASQGVDDPPQEGLGDRKFGLVPHGLHQEPRADAVCVLHGHQEHLPVLEPHYLGAYGLALTHVDEHLLPKGGLGSPGLHQEAHDLGDAAQDIPGGELADLGHQAEEVHDRRSFSRDCSISSSRRFMRRSTVASRIPSAASRRRLPRLSS